MTQDQFQTLLNSIREIVREELKKNDETNQQEKWWTPNDLAKAVGRAVLTVREWCRLHRIPSRQDSLGRRWIADTVAQLVIRYQGLPPEEELAGVAA